MCLHVMLALDMSIRPLDDWTFKCPMDISICPFVHWTSGHIQMSDGHLDMSICPLDEQTFKCPLDISVCLIDGLNYILDISVLSRREWQYNYTNA